MIHSWARPSRVQLFLFALASGGLLVQSISASPLPATTITAGQERHKVQISLGSPVEAFLPANSRLLVDYGGYRLYETGELLPNLLSSPGVQIRDEYNQVFLNAAHLDTSKSVVQALRRPVGDFIGRRTHLIQFVGPVQGSWFEALVQTGAKVVAYIPHSAYLVYGDAAALSRLQALAEKAPHIQWEAPFENGYKIHPATRFPKGRGQSLAIQPDQFAVQMVVDPEANAETLKLLDQLGKEPYRRPQKFRDFLNVVVRLSSDDLLLVANQPEVVSIQPYSTPEKLCERQDQIVAGNLSGNVPSGPGYLAWLAGRGFTQAQFTASSFVVDICDSGIDNGTTSPYHLGLHVEGIVTNSSRVAYSRLEGTPNPSSTLAGCDGHGTLNAHLIGGYNDLSALPHVDVEGYHYGLGVCPFVKVGASVVFDPDNFTSPDYPNMQSAAYHSGARISNNSWGSAANGVYDFAAQTYDALVRDAQPDGAAYAVPGNQEMVVVFAAGNLGPYAQTVVSPGSAKNVLSIGASENVQAFGGADMGGITDAQADNANDIASFSSVGPCADGRHKPDLVAPGSHVSGGVVQVSNPGLNGTADSCFIANGTGVTGGPNNDVFWPAGQEFYTACSGSSQSAPCVSGACALLRQYFLNTSRNAPSPAMSKAFLINSARYMTGSGANDSLWSDSQGMGELNLGTAFDGTARILRDQTTTDLFTASGQIRTFVGTIADTNQPFRVTLAWSDAPGSTAGNAYNNNLDLTVVVGGQTFLGNVFQGPHSVTGGSPDNANNVESVFLPAGVSGSFAVTVAATDINSDGVPNNAYPLDQDFALVVYNARGTGGPVISPAAASLLSETCAPTNGAIDPGETVTVTLALRNIGTVDTTNLVATLLSQDGVWVPSAPQTYGTLVAGGSASARAFTFTASGACGGQIKPTLHLQEGATSLGAVSFALPLGGSVSLAPLNENFDGVSAPGLPVGWTTMASGGGVAWATDPSTAASSPNSAYAPDYFNAGVGELISPSVSVSSAGATLTFAQNYDLEADPSTPLAYDGGVLEISLGGGTFTDILAAGGSFVSGGYNHTIDSTADNPLGGRRSWSGSSYGFVTTIVRLPSAAAGSNIQLKWRLATDTGNQYGGSAWYVDNVSIQDTNYTCCTSLVPPAIGGIETTSTNVTISSTSVPGHVYSLQFKASLSNSTWMPLTSGVPGTGNLISLVDTNAPRTNRFYRVKAQ